MDVEHEFPCCAPRGRVEFGGFYLTHAIWRNSYGSYQPETGVRRKQVDGTYAEFELVQHNNDNWPLVTAVLLAGLSKGWRSDRIANVIEWLGKRNKIKARVM